jgi:O-antigen/teichoic acid export membrane protein
VADEGIRAAAKLKDGSRISVNAGYQLFAQAALLALNLIASPIVVHGLGLEAYGLLILVGVTTNYFGFVELGLGRAAVQVLAGHRSRGEHEDFVVVLWTATAAYLALALAGAGVLIAAAPLLVNRALNVSPALVPQARVAFVIGAVGLVIALQRNVASSVATAMERFDLISRVTLGLGAVQAALTISLVLMGAGLIEVMLGGLAVTILGLLVYFGISVRLLPTLFPPRVTMEKLRVMVRLGGYISISQVISPVLEQIDKVFIGAFAAVDQLPYYSVPFSVAWALTAVPTSLVTVIYPAMARLLAQEDHAGVRETMRRATRYIFVVLVGPVVLLVIYAPEILTAWMGTDFAVRAGAPLRILAIAVLVNVVSWPSYHLLHAAGRADLTARYHLIELITHVPVSIFLIIHFGVVGAAAGWLLRVALDTTLVCRAAGRIVGTGLAPVVQAMGRGTLAALAFLPVAVGGRPWLDPTNRWQAFLFFLVVGLCYTAPVIWLGLGSEERSALRGTVLALLGGKRATRVRVE